MTLSLAGALAKVARAEEHLRTLEDEIRAWREDEGATFSSTHNPIATERRFYIDYLRPPNAARWALLIGDCVHNLRSSLDHVVYELSGPEPPERCEFPIFRDRDLYFLPAENRSGGLHKIRGIQHEGVRILVEGAQPWQRPNRTQDHELWVIHQLDIEDKHHLLVPVGTVPRNIAGKIRAWTLSGQPMPPGTDVFLPKWITLESHAELLMLRTPVPAKRVIVDFEVGVTVALRLGGRLVPAPDALRKPCQYTRTLIEQIGNVL